MSSIYIYIYIYKTEDNFSCQHNILKKKKKQRNKPNTQNNKTKKKNVMLITRYSRCSEKPILLRKKSLFLISLSLPSPSPKTQNSDNLSSHIWPSQLLRPNLRFDHLLQTFWIRIQLWSSKSETHRHGLPYLPCLQSIFFLRPPTTHIKHVQPRNGTPFAVGLTHQLCRLAIHPIQPVETGPKVTTKQI